MSLQELLFCFASSKSHLFVTSPECFSPPLFRCDLLRGCVSVRGGGGGGGVLAEKSYFLIWSSSCIRAVSS
jgi:hypothetical protein